MISSNRIQSPVRQLSCDHGITRMSRKSGLTMDMVRNLGEISNASKIASGSQERSFVEAIVSLRNIDTFPLTLLISEKREAGRVMSTSLQRWECKSNTSSVELLDSTVKEAQIDSGCPPDFWRVSARRGLLGRRRTSVIIRDQSLAESNATALQELHIWANSHGDRVISTFVTGLLSESVSPIEMEWKNISSRTSSGSLRMGDMMHKRSVT